jgi:hypothetical protein
MQNLQIQAAQTHFWCAQMNITRLIYAVSTHNYARKLVQVIETRGILSSDWTSWYLFCFCNCMKGKIWRVLHNQSEPLYQ